MGSGAANKTNSKLKMKTLKAFPSLGLALLFFLSYLLPSASGATFTWSGLGTDDNLATPDNWVGGSPPTATDDVVFTGSIRNNPVSTGQQYLTITFDAAANPFVIGGTSIQTGTTAPAGGSVTNFSPFAQTFNCSLQPRTGTLFASGGDIILNGGFNIGNGGNSSGRNVTVAGGRDVIVNTALTGTGTDSSAGGQLTKAGSGTLFLNGSSPAWNGKINLQIGALVITNNDGLGSSSGSTVIASSGGSAVWDGRLILSNNLTLAERFTLGSRQQGSLNSAHILNLATTNTLAGAITLTTGGSRYNLQSDGGKLVVAGAISAGTLTGTRELRLAGSADGELNGPVSGGGASIMFQFIKEGGGRWTLNGTNSINGNTLVNAGTLALGPTGRIAGSTNISVAAGATLDVSAVSGGWVLAGNQTLAGAGTVLGNVTTADGSRVRPGGPGAAGTLTFVNNLTQTAATTNYFDLAGSTAPGGGNDLINVNGNLEPNGAVIVISALGQLTAPGTYRLFNYTGTKTTSFSAVLSGDSRYAFSLDESTPGQVNVVVSGAPSSLVWSGGSAGVWDVMSSLSWNGNSQAFYQADSVTFDDTAATNFVNLATTLYPSAVNLNASADYVFAGAGKLSGAMSLTKSGAGSLMISNANDFTGPVTITGGTLLAGNAAALGATNSGTFVSGGGTLDVLNKNLGLEPITIAGAGVGGNGAVVNSGGEQQNAVRLLTLADDAAIGGVNRWDVRGAGGNSSFSGWLDLAGHTLTKVGANKIGLVDSVATNSGSLLVSDGTLAITRSLVEGPGTIEIASSGVLQIENYTTGYLAKPLIGNGGRLLVTGNDFILGSPVTSLGGLTIENAVALTLTNDLSGSGSLAKQGTGVLTLQRPAAHGGPTMVRAGSVVLGADSGLPNSSEITVEEGATLDASALPAGLLIGSGRSLGGAGTVVGNISAVAGASLVPGSSPGTLTISGNLSLNNISAEYELGASPWTPGANDQITVWGDLNLAGVSTVRIVPLAALDTSSPYTLFQYSTLSSGSAANLNVVSDSRYNFTVLDPAFTPGMIQVQVSGSGAAATLVWRGNDPVNPTYWDTKVTANWLNGVTPDRFFLGDAVVFDDSAVGTSVSLIGTLQPSTVSLNNFTKPFTLGGAGSVVAGSLAASGAALTTFANSADNTFVGGVAVNSGLLRFANAGANNFGSGININGGSLTLANSEANTLGSVTVAAGSLVVSNAGLNLFSPLTVSGGDVRVANNAANTFSSIALDAGTLTFDQPQNVAVTAAISGGGSLIKNATNTLTLSANNSGFFGGIQVNSGTLRPGTANALGSGSGGAFDGTTIASGATLDVNGINLGNELVTVSGAGVGGLGAIVNSGAGQNNALHDVLLAGDTTFGGAGRWDIRTNANGLANLSTGGNAYNLTKVGANQVSLVSAVVDAALADVDVLAGTFSYEVASTGLGNPARTATVHSNATFQLWALLNPLDKTFRLKNGSNLRIGSGTGNILTGAIELESGNANINAVSGTQVILSGSLTGAGGFTKPETGTVILAGANNFAGNITNLAGGIIMFSNSLAAGANKLVWNNSTTGGSGSTGTRITLAGNSVIPASVSVSFNGETNGDIRSTFFSQAGSNVWEGPVQLRGSGIINATVDSPNNFTISGPVSGIAGFTGTFFVRGSGGGEISGAINLGGGILAKTDGGTWTISSSGNTWGQTTIAVGTIRLGAHDALCPTAALLMGQGDAQAAALDLNGFNQTVVEIRPVLGTGTRRIGNDSTTADSVFTYAGGTNVNTFAGQFFDNLTTNGTRKLGLTVASGTLYLTGSSSNTGPTLVSGGILGGTGSLVSPLTVGPLGTLAPGLSIGTFTVNAPVTLQGTNVMEVSKAGSTITTDRLAGVTTLTYGGVLRLVLSGDPLAAGDTVKLYDAAAYAGDFAEIVPAAPGTGLFWDTSTLAVDGTLRVRGLAAPAVASVTPLPDGNIGLTITGLVGQAYSVRASTDVGLPVGSWTLLQSGSLPASPFVFNDLTATNFPRRFYILSTP